MSDPKKFLSRWSQRKLNPEAEKAAPAEKESQLSGKDAATPPAPELEFDVTTLPSLESIGANSDISVFLQRGVPASLTRAALRRAWSADPAIRDFIGLSENSWDFNAEDSMRGFGSLDPEEARRIAARFFGEPAEPAQASPDRGVPTQLASGATESDARSARETQTEALQGHSCVSEESVAGAKQPPEPDKETDASSGAKRADVAAQHDGEPARSLASQKRHGGALPK